MLLHDSRKFRFDPNLGSPRPNHLVPEPPDVLLVSFLGPLGTLAGTRFCIKLVAYIPGSILYFVESNSMMNFHDSMSFQGHFAIALGKLYLSARLVHNNFAGSHLRPQPCYCRWPSLRLSAFGSALCWHKTYFCINHSCFWFQMAV